VSSMKLTSARVAEVRVGSWAVAKYKLNLHL
jgi:hypothetical protein